MRDGVWSGRIGALIDAGGPAIDSTCSASAYDMSKSFISASQILVQCGIYDSGIGGL
jgi:hypothetical protein